MILNAEQSRGFARASMQSRAVSAPNDGALLARVPLRCAMGYDYITLHMPK